MSPGIPGNSDWRLAIGAKFKIREEIYPKGHCLPDPSAKPNMFTSTSRLLLRLAATRFPCTPVQRSPLSRCCHLHGNEQQRREGEHPRVSEQLSSPTRAEESVESSRDTFGALSSSLTTKNLQRRLDNEWFQDVNDDEDEFREKIEDTLRPRFDWISDRL